MPTLRELQAEWNALVPVAHSLGIYSGVRILRSVHENVNIGTTRVAELRNRIAARQPTSTAIPARVTGEDTFGVEIECILPPGTGHATLARLITEAGVDCYAEGYNHTTGSNWKVVTDGSLGSYINGAEVVSPILRGEAGFAAMTKVLNAVKAAGAKINHRCGFHVHIGARQENVHFFRNLARLYRHFDGAINSVLAHSRRNNGFALTHSINETALDAAQSVDAVTLAVGQRPGIGNVRSHWRYRKLNFCSYWQHGTVEFRQHQGTVEAHKAANWVRFCLAMVEKARAGTTGAGNADTLEALMDTLGTSAMDRAYFASRAAVFAARTPRRRAYI